LVHVFPAEGADLARCPLPSLRPVRFGYGESVTTPVTRERDRRQVARGGCRRRSGRCLRIRATGRPRGRWDAPWCPHGVSCGFVLDRRDSDVAVCELRRRPRAWPRVPRGTPIACRGFPRLVRRRASRGDRRPGNSTTESGLVAVATSARNGQLARATGSPPLVQWTIEPRRFRLKVHRFSTSAFRRI